MKTHFAIVYKQVSYQSRLVMEVEIKTLICHSVAGVLPNSYSELLTQLNI